MPAILSRSTNSLVPGRRTVTLPLMGRTTTLSWNFGVGAGVGVAVGVDVGAGCGWAIENVNGGESEALPAASSVRTVNRYSPGASPPYVCGDAQGTNVPSRPGPCSEHSNVASGSRAVNDSVAASRCALAVGCAGVGAVTSTVQVLTAGWPRR